MRSTEARYANASDRGNGGRCCRVGDGQHRDLPHPSLLASVSWGRVPTMLGHMKLSDSTLVIVLHNGEQEIERELAPPADALRVALMMLVRRRRLEIGDVLEVMARTERRWGRRERVHETHAPTLAEGARTSAPAGTPDAVPVSFCLAAYYCNGSAGD
jgi:hypothetical protein